MASAYSKAKLKESREAIQQKRWDDARQAASDALEEDPVNYNANVFLGLALLNLTKYDESEQAYQKAIAAQPSQPLAYQGLEKFYTQRKEWEKLVRLLRTQADLALESEDAKRCAECLQSIIRVQREEGARSQRAEALSLVLPDSKYYGLLSTLPAPEPTKQETPTFIDVQMATTLDSLKITQKVIGLVEYVEQDLIEKEAEKKRMRIEGAGKSREVLRNEAGASIWSNSKLPTYYEQVLSHTDASNEERRDAEAKLLRYQLRLLLALPASSSTVQMPTGTAARATGPAEDIDNAASSAKTELRDKILEMAKGMVIVGVPDELAWSIHLEWQDFGSLPEIPRHLMRQFVSLFPRSNRTSAFTALLLLFEDKQFLTEVEELKKISDVDHGLTDKDPLALVSDALQANSESLLVPRIAARLYLLDRDFASAHEVAAGALVMTRNTQKDTEVNLLSIELDLQSISGVALTHIHGTQNHVKAMRLLDEYLSHKTSLDVLFARGFIDATANRYGQARDFYAQAAKAQTPGDLERAHAERALTLHKAPETEAQGELAWCDVQMGQVSEGLETLEHVISILDQDAQQDESQQEFTDEDRARAWWRSGHCIILLAETGEAEHADAFTRYITSIKRSPSFAPAFDALGTYYEAYQSPPDLARSSKCFQKAFELDATQSHSARKLAEHYADEREWDLVSLVARRVIDGEGGSAALSGDQAPAAAQKHKSSNGWAWKAIGLVRLEKGEAQEEISPLHIALRADAEDASLWQRLGEAYMATGRFTAALKTFEKALETGVADDWQTRYCIAEIRREWGEYDEALAIFDAILAERANEFGVRTAAAETQLLKSRKERAMGFVERSESSLILALQEAKQVLEAQPLLRSAWKVVSDACFDLSTFGHVLHAETVTATLLSPLVALASQQGVDEKLPAVTVVSHDTANAGIDSKDASRTSIEASAYINKLRIILCASDDNLVGSAWADLSIVLSRLAKDAQGDRRSAVVKQAIDCVKEALNHEPANSSFWLLLGNLTFESSIKVAQHAYVRSIENSLNDPVPWANLGLLYLQHGDVELAREALMQAQTVDPEYAGAWVGLALVAQEAQDEQNAMTLFGHAVELSEGSVLEADYGLASSLFLSRHSPTGPTPAVHTASFALSTLLSHEPRHINALHLSALYAERLGEYTLAIERVEKASSLLEQEFENTEDPQVALRFAVVQSNLARIRLATGDVQGATEAAEVALGLLDDDTADDEEAATAIGGEQRIRARCNTQLSLALAQYHSGSVELALSTLTTARQELGSRANEVQLVGKSHMPLLVTLQAQLQYVLGKVEEAKSTLLDAIASTSTDVVSIVTLGAIAVLEQDADLLDAALSELDSTEDSGSSLSTHAVGLLRSSAEFIAGRDEAALRLLQGDLRQHEQRLAECGSGASRTLKADRAEQLFARQLEYAEALVRCSLAASQADGASSGQATAAQNLCQKLQQGANPDQPFGTVEQKGRLLRLSAIVACIVPPSQQDAQTLTNGTAQAEEDGEDAPAGAVKAEDETATTDTSKQKQGLTYARRAVLEDPTEALNWAVLDITSAFTLQSVS